MTEVSGATVRPAGRRRGSRQAAVIESVLRDADGFRTAQQIHDEIRRRGETVGLTTVYRLVNLLTETGRADTVHRADGEAQFRLCGPAVGSRSDAGRHHHHVVCRECGRSVEVSGPEVEDWAERVATAAGYTDVTHTLEIFGLCTEHAARHACPAPG